MYGVQVKHSLVFAQAEQRNDNPVGYKPAVLYPAHHSSLVSFISLFFLKGL